MNASEADRIAKDEKRTIYGEAKRFYQDTVLTYDGDDCLIWTYARNAKGYGRMWADGRLAIVSRLLCEEIHGPPPTQKHEASHSCGNGHLGCVTKRHLSWRTHAENCADKLIHGTHNRGARHSQAKITEDQAREIISLRGKELLRETGARFGISGTVVSRIQSGENWAWLSEQSPIVRTGIYL